MIRVPPDQWSHVIFSDEKKFNLDGPDGWAYYWRDIRTEPLHFKKRQGGGASVMIWAGIWSHGRTAICFEDRNINSEVYCDMLNTYLLPVRRYFLNPPLIFMQDNAPAHRSQFTKNWLTDHEVNILPWPPYSPDLNPIEHCWALLSREVYKENRQFDNVNQLKAAILSAWDEIDAEAIANLIESMPQWVEAVRQARGGHTAY